MKPAVKWATAPTRPAPTAPATTSPATTSPILAVDRPAGSSGVTRVVATSSQVDAMAVTRRAVWLAVGGLVLRVDPATVGRNLHELNADRITAMAAAEDGGLWLGTANGLFHVDQSVLGQR